jgi:hypothetical protein
MGASHNVYTYGGGVNEYIELLFTRNSLKWKLKIIRETWGHSWVFLESSQWLGFSEGD